MKKVIRLTERDLTRIVKRVIAEQTIAVANADKTSANASATNNMSSFIEKNYVKPLLQQGYKEVDKISLVNGNYMGGGTRVTDNRDKAYRGEQNGYRIDLYSVGTGQTFTGYIIITNGIKGAEKNLRVIVKPDGSFEIPAFAGTDPKEVIYKVLYKQPQNIQTPGMGMR